MDAVSGTLSVWDRVGIGWETRSAHIQILLAQPYKLTVIVFCFFKQYLVAVLDEAVLGGAVQTYFLTTNYFERYNFGHNTQFNITI